MDEANIQVPAMERHEILAYFLEQMDRIIEEPNPYKKQIRHHDLIIEVYKKGIFNGFHQANGSNILKNIQPDQQ